MRLKGAIFDLDGTLLDSMGVWDGAGEKYLARKGRIPAPGLREILRPMTMAETAEYFRKEYGVPGSIEDICGEINALIEDGYVNFLPMKEAAGEFLRKLKEHGVRMCVATATDRPLAEGALRRLGVEGFFRGILTCSETGCGKDRPDIFLKALALLGTAMEETVVFEDSLHAIKTAKAAGFKVAAVYDASADGNREEIRACADWYLGSFNEWVWEEE